MKKEMIILMSVILLLSIMLVSGLQFYQTKIDMGNKTIRLFSFVQYQDSELIIDQYTTDYVISGKPLEIAIKYNSYIKTWNQRNIYNKVSYCNFSVRYSPAYFNSSILLFNETLTEDTAIKTYYVSLNKNEEFSVYMDCKFSGTVPTGLEIPATFSINTPTNECKSCQMYQWQVQERQIVKAQALGDFSLNIVSYIGKLIAINFETLLSLFWIALIIIFLYSFSLIFEVAIFLIKYVNGIGK